MMIKYVGPPCVFWTGAAKASCFHIREVFRAPYLQHKFKKTDILAGYRSQIQLTITAKSVDVNLANIS